MNDVLQQSAFLRFSNLGFQYKLLPIFFTSASLPRAKIKLPRDSSLDNAIIRGISVVTGNASDLVTYTNEVTQVQHTVLVPADMAKFTINLMIKTKPIFNHFPVNSLRSFSVRGNKFLATNFRFNTFDSYLFKTNGVNLAQANSVILLEFLYEQK